MQVFDQVRMETWIWIFEKLASGCMITLACKEPAVWLPHLESAPDYAN